MAELVQKLCQCKVVDCKWVELAWDGSVTNRGTQRRFRGSVKCGAPSMENRVQVAKYLFEVRMASSLVCLVQNGPGVIRVACICLGDAKKKHHGPPSKESEKKTYTIVLTGLNFILVYRLIAI